MRSSLLFSLSLICHLVSVGQQPYWQQETNYVIDVRLNDTQHSLDGFLKLEYINRSPDSLTFIWFHLWPNAFKNDRTAFSEQLLQNNRTDFYFSNKEDRGYINRLDFRMNNATLKTEDHPLYVDIIKVYLESPLAPGATAQITTPFHVKLPKNFSRGGHTGRSYQITQWYPKPAVYDRKGWHPMPYLDQGEFYSEFGNYDVRISVPKSYVVAATGEDAAFKIEDTQVAQPEPSTTSVDVSQPKKVTNSSNADKKKPVKIQPRAKSSPKKAPTKKNSSLSKKSNLSQKVTVTKQVPEEFKTLRYTQNRVHDFAWFADKKFVVKRDTIQLPSGRIVNAQVYHVSKSAVWENAIRTVKDAVQFRSIVMGEYPFNTVTVVESKMGFEGGMEYPTITSISPMEDASELEQVIEHEVGHNWLQGVIANNERAHPWMDEGINSYYDRRYKEWKNGTAGKTSKLLPADPEGLLVDAYAHHRLDQPITTSSEKFTEVNYLLVAYAKTARWMKQLEDSIGRESLDKCMKEYFSRWQFKHPYPEDLIELLQSCADQRLTAHFSALDTKGSLHNRKRKLKPAFLFSLKETDKYSYLNFFPAAGYNQYDGFMMGAVIHNYNLPSNRLQFVAVPLYATGSRQLSGIGRAGYSWFPGKTFSRIELAANVARFSTLKGVDSNNTEIFGRFTKVAPSLRFTFNNKYDRSTLEKWLEWKSFFFAERGFRYVEKSQDQLFYPTRASTQQRYLNQLTFSITDYRKLYPYDVQLQFQQGDGFYRANATANYFYNYARGGGMRVRFFAAKFGYIGGKTSAKEFETAVYQPKLTAVRGYEDYTYSNVFFGRNESDNFSAQQMMLRDGGLKLRTDLFQGLQGRSDNWVTSLNFNTTLPEKLFPVRLPLRIFFDVGTYADAWKKDAATSRFLYVGGLQVSLFKNLVNVYAPVIYSREFRDNLKTVPEENKFFKRLSFSVDLHRFDLRRVVGYKVPI